MRYGQSGSNEGLYFDNVDGNDFRMLIGNNKIRLGKKAEYD